MAFKGFEGPAGTGKTHELIAAVRAEAAKPGFVAHQRVLALTFMHGSRRRLDERLRAFPETRRRSVCMTVDSFAGHLVHRWRSSVGALPDPKQFDDTCEACGVLLERPEIARWVARTFPIVAVDEAQELRPCRLRIIKALADHTQSLIAADEFQCLDQGTDTGPFLEWFHAGDVQPLTAVRRTTRPGLLNAAIALRQGGAPANGVGLSIHYRHPNQAPFAIGHVLNHAVGRTAVLVAPGGTEWAERMIPRWVQGLQSPLQTVPPLKVGWEDNPSEEAAAIAGAVCNGNSVSNANLVTALTSLPKPPVWLRAALATIDVARRAHGRTQWNEPDLLALLERKASAHRAFGFSRARDIPVMSVHAAKNRQFRNVVVLWTHGVVGTAEHKRRLLYNAITRAEHQCSVFVRAQELLNAAPFN